MVLLLLLAALPAEEVSAAAAMAPLLFMERRDLVDTFGKLTMVANEVQRMPGFSSPPGLNYTGGDTVTAAFPLLDGTGAEIFVAVGRPGEPFVADGAGGGAGGGAGCLCSNTCPQGCNPDQGVKLQRFTTSDFKRWSEPVTVLYLPNGSGAGSDDDGPGDGDAPGELGLGARTTDGTIWTIKSMDRNEHGAYLLAASYGSSVHFFWSPTPPTKTNSFTPLNSERSLKKSNFKDHDDVRWRHFLDKSFRLANLQSIPMHR